MTVIAYIGCIFLSIEQKCTEISSYGTCLIYENEFNFVSFIIYAVSITIGSVFLYGFSTIIENTKETKEISKSIYKELKKKNKK